MTINQQHTDFKLRSSEMRPSNPATGVCIGRLCQSAIVIAYVVFMVMMLRFDFRFLYRVHIERKFSRTVNSTKESTIRYKPPFLWEAMPGLNNTISTTTSFHSPQRFKALLSERIKHKTVGSDWLGGQPLYVSLTTIHSRVYGLASTIESIIEGTILPDHIYIFVSRDPYLLDHGVTIDFILAEFTGLNKLLLDYPYISIIFTENIGPHRKLLPLLSQKWNEDCVILTIDDHEIYAKSTISSLLEYYNSTDRKAVVALRSRRMGVCGDAPPWRLSAYTQNGKGLWPLASAGRREMLTLPTGTGGVLYRPIFFHPVVFDRRFLNLTQTGDDLMFRLATMAKGVSVVTACVDERGSCPDTAKVASLRQYKLIMNFTDIHLQPDFVKQQQLQHITDTEYYTRGTPGSNADGDGEGDGIWTGEDVWASINSINSINSIKYDFAASARKNATDSSHSKAIRLEMLNSASGLLRHRLLRARQHFTQARAQRRRLRGSNPSDPRKIDSLASKFNSKGGNNVMWEQSVKFLREEGIFDFEELLQKYAPLERNACLLSSSVVQPRASEIGMSFAMTRFFYSTLQSVKVSVQNFYDKECGIQVCGA